jgi:UDP-N-acetylmuramoylalanine--D-glutamate ligase
VASANTIALTGLIPVQKIIDIQDVPVSIELKIKGEHNRRNLGAALSVLMAAGIDPGLALRYLPDFSGLPHRLEYIGRFEGIDFYNDSIATVPEATIAAMETLAKVDFLILGGFDRGISYQALADYLLHKPVKKILYCGLAGERISSLLTEKSRHGLISIDSLDDMVRVLKKFAQSGDVCLLSPAAASYDRFRNFEHRGDHFKQLVRSNFGQ